MVDIQSAAAEIRRGEKREKKQERRRRKTNNRMNGLPYYIERP